MHSSRLLLDYVQKWPYRASFSTRNDSFFLGHAPPLLSLLSTPSAQCFAARACNRIMPCLLGRVVEQGGGKGGGHGHGQVMNARNYFPVEWMRSPKLWTKSTLFFYGNRRLAVPFVVAGELCCVHSCIWLLELPFSKCLWIRNPVPCIHLLSPFVAKVETSSADKNDNNRPRPPR